MLVIGTTTIELRKAPTNGPPLPTLSSLGGMRGGELFSAVNSMPITALTTETQKHRDTERENPLGA
jgi:hypothetical protein